MLVAVLVGTGIGTIAPLSSPIPDLAYTVPSDPPAILPVMIWPLAPIPFIVALLFGPLAGLITGLGTQVLSLVLGGFDLTATWNWALAGGLGGFLAGWIPHRLPLVWQPSGRRRLAGAAVSGLVASLVGFLPVLLDPLARPGASWPLALGEYVTIVVPNSILDALVLPIVLALAIRLHVHPALDFTGQVVGSRPSWRPFALALALAAAVPLAQLYVPSNVRVVGQVSAEEGPAAAPGPGASAGNERVVSLSLGNPVAIDPSCEGEGKLRSEPVTSLVHVTLYNETGTPIGVSWLDFEGSRDEVHFVSADDPLDDYWGAAGHLFVLTGQDGGCLMIIKVLGTSPIVIHLQA